MDFSRIPTYIDTLPAYLLYVGTAILIHVVASFVYKLITPYDEVKLIRAGNSAAAIAFGGMMIGLALVQYTVLKHAVSIIDLALWSTIALGFQLAVFFGMSLLLRDMKENIVADKTSYGVALGAANVAAGLLNAGALTP